MISLWDVLKASKGLPVSDFYAAMWGKQIAGKYTIAELEGALPLTFNANGEALIDYRIYGNTEQTGTPTPENPVDAVGCGERTENVMPAGEQKTVVSNGVTFSSDGNGRYHISGTATADALAQFNLLSAFTTPISVSNGGQGTLSFFNTQSNINVSFVFYNGTTMVDGWRMYTINRTSTTYNAIGNKYIDNFVIIINSGETVDMTIMPEFTNDGVLPSEFEPWGIKIPISSANTTTPVYLGEVETTRRIKKLVLTGEENWLKNDTSPNNCLYYLSGLTGKEQADCICTHFQQSSTTFPANNQISAKAAAKMIYIYLSKTIIDTMPSGNTKEGFKEYLAAQYAAGTPVIVWYVLATEETAVVNEPLMKIGDYVDTLSMEQAGVSIPTNKGTTVIDYDGTPKPSQMYIKYLEVKND